MKIKQLIEALQNNIADNKQNPNIGEIDALLEELEEKKRKLTAKLNDDPSASKRRRLKTKLKVVNLQIKKGKERRNQISLDSIE